MSDSNRFPFAEFGNSKSKDIVVLLAGFPDDAVSGWKPLIDRMKVNNVGNDRRYICLCLPGYQNDAPPLPRWGISFPELMTLLHSTLEDLIPGDIQYSLIIHDWGCYVGFVYRTLYPAKIKRIVALDVGFIDEKEQPLYPTFVTIFYQWFWAISFIVSQLFGQTIGQCVFVLSILVISNVKFLSPTPWDVPPRPIAEVKVRMCYPYYQLWKDIFSGKMMRPEFPSDIPLLYLFGTKKNVLFHTSSFLKQIEDSKASRWRSFDCGHWLMHYESDGVTHEIETFFKETS